MAEKIRSAAELSVDKERGQTQQQLLDNIRGTALRQVESFAKQQGMGPAEFMSAHGWMESDKWKKGVEWTKCINWSSFNDIVFSNISSNKKGLDIGAFNTQLREEHESYVASAIPRKEERRAVPQPNVRLGWSEVSVAMTPADKHAEMALERAQEIFDKYPLTASDRIRLGNIMSRNDPLLAARNIEENVRFLVGEGRLTPTQGNTLNEKLQRIARGAQEDRVAQERMKGSPIAAYAHANRPEEIEAFRRSQQGEAYRYTVAVYDSKKVSPKNPEGKISAYTIVSEKPIAEVDDFMKALREAPEGMTVTRQVKGKDIKVEGEEQLRLLADGLRKAQLQANYTVKYAKVEEAAPRKKAA